MAAEEKCRRQTISMTCSSGLCAIIIAVLYAFHQLYCLEWSL